MPILQRRALRRAVGQRRLRETLTGVTTFSPAVGAGSFVTVLARSLALPDFSGQDMYQHSWLRVGTGNLTSFQDYRVGSFNVGSGAFTGLATAIDPIASGADFEIHEKLDPAEIDRAIDETILTLRVRREVGIPSIDGALFYTLDGAASPNTIIGRPLDAYYFANPSSSVNRDRREFNQHDIVTTATGVELRIPGGLGASVQIVLDAMLCLSLGAGGDAATINLPDEETILWGAAARCYDLLIQDAPSQEASLYKERRKEAAATFTRLAGRFFPHVARPLTFDQPFTPAALE